MIQRLPSTGEASIVLIPGLSRQLQHQSEISDSTSFSQAKVVNKFTITGRSGLPPNPKDTLQNESMQTNWVTTDPPVENSNRDDSSANPPRSVPAKSNVSKTPTLVEAQGWLYGPNGEVILTAQSPTVIPHNPLLTPAASCNAK